MATPRAIIANGTQTDQSFHAPQSRFTLHVLSYFITLLILLLTLPTQAAEDAVDSFLTGLDSLAAGKFEDASQSLAKATQANPQIANWNLNQAIALMMINHADEARNAITTAEKLDPRNSEIHLWSSVRAIMFDPTLPQTPTHPLKELAYSPKLLLAVIGTKSRNEAESARARTAIKEVIRDLAKEQRTGVEAIKALYTAKRYKEALALIDTALTTRPADGTLLGFAGHCNLGLKNFPASRQNYTQALQSFPTEAGYLIGRARCEIALAAIEPAETDLSLATRVAYKSYEALLTEAQQLLSTVKEHQKHSPEIPTRTEQYTREHASLLLDVRDNPNQFQPLIALSQFYLQPTAICDLKLNGTFLKAKVPCGKMELPRSADALARAVKLAPDDPAVILQQARVAFADRQPDKMMTFAQLALDKGTTDLEIAAAYLKYNSEGAKQRTAEAKKLRAPGYFRDKRLDNGMYIKEYVGPSADDYTRADGLDRNAKIFHDMAPKALELLQKQTAQKTDQESKAIHSMTNAYHDAWFTNPEGAITAAEQALTFDPANAHALRFLIAAYKSKNSPKAKQYQTMLEEIERF